MDPNSNLMKGVTRLRANARSSSPPVDVLKPPSLEPLANPMSNAIMPSSPKARPTRTPRQRESRSASLRPPVPWISAAPISPRTNHSPRVSHAGKSWAAAGRAAVTSNKTRSARLAL